MEQEYKDFEKEIVAFQEILCNLQINAIKRTLTIIETKTNALLREQIKENVVRSIEWCEQHGIEINNFYKDTNQERILEILAKELLTPSSSSYGSLVLYKYRNPSDQTPRPTDSSLVRQTPASQTVQSCSEASPDHNPASGSSQTETETRFDNWEIVRRQQRVFWKVEPR